MSGTWVDQKTMARALGLDDDATDEEIVAQGKGLLTSIQQLREVVYAGHIDPILEQNGVRL